MKDCERCQGIGSICIAGDCAKMYDEETECELDCEYAKVCPDCNGSGEDKQHVR